MFCPTCGREDAQERKFCPSCGTNLDRVSRALTPGKNNVLEMADEAFDRLLAKYAGLFFKSAPEKAMDRSLINSWIVFGQSLLALLANFVLIPLCAVALKFRFFVLLISTPFRMLSERNRQQSRTAELQLPTQEPWLINPMPSATDHTTLNLSTSSPPKQKIR